VSTPATSAFDLERFLTVQRERIEVALEVALADALPHMEPAVREPVRMGVTTGGKRLRPILCVAAYDACGGTAPGIEGLAVSIEMIHAYSLMHDDLPCMDDAPLRRGRPTPHTLHGEAATMIGGAALIPAAHLQAWKAALAMGVGEATARELVRTLAVASGGVGMVGGQGLDLLGEGRALSRTELDDLHRRKTGALLTAPLRMGALAAGAPAEVTAALERYGRAVGHAFQIADDVLDATADAERLGKEPSDAALGKSTYVALLGVKGARGEAGALVGEALDALGRAGVQSEALEALAAYTVSRDR